VAHLGRLHGGGRGSFPSIYGGSGFVVMVELVLLGVYLYLAIVSARERRRDGIRTSRS